MSLSQTIQVVINSLAEGFVVFNAQGVCSSISSRRACELFGEELIGKHICDLMRVAEEDRVGFMDWYEFMFTPGVDFENIASLGPSVLEHPSLYIAIKYRPVIEEGQILSVVMILSDLTSERAATKESEGLRNYADMLKRFFADRENFIRVLEAIRLQLEELRTWKIKSLNDHEAILRQFHNIKGLAGMLSAGELIKAAHEAESALILEWSRSSLPAEFEPMVHTAAEMALMHYSDFVREHSSIFGLHSHLPKNSTIVSSDLLLDFYLKLQSSDVNGLAKDFAASILMIPLLSPLEELANHARSTAHSMGKQLFVSFEVDPHAKIFGVSYRKLFDALFHLINNSLDHGFEKPERRESLGKLKDGRLTLGGSVVGTQSIKLFLHDDGAGIDPEQIRQKLYQMHVNCSRETDAQVIYHIFDPGFTTKTVISEKSGRGIGMDAVHFEIKKLGGKIELRSEKGQGTRFDITVPYLSPESEIRKVA